MVAVILTAASFLLLCLWFVNPWAGSLLFLALLFFGGLALAGWGVASTVRDAIRARRACRGRADGLAEATFVTDADRSPRWLGVGLIVIGALAACAPAAILRSGGQAAWPLRHWRPLLAVCIAWMSVSILHARRGRSIWAALALLVAAALLLPPDVLESAAYRLTGDPRFRPPR